LAHFFNTRMFTLLALLATKRTKVLKLSEPENAFVRHFLA